MNMKRFIIIPVVFALGWLSFGIGRDLSRVNRKVMSRNAGESEMEDGPVSREVCFCDPNHSLFDVCLGKGVILPCLCKKGFYGDRCNNVCPCNIYGSDGCDNKGICNCTEGFIGDSCTCPIGFHGDRCGTACGCDKDRSIGNGCNFQGECKCKSGSFGKQCNNVLNLGSAKAGDRWYFIATCNGLCKQVEASVDDISGNPDLFVARQDLPRLDFNAGCLNCDCVSQVYGQNNSCILPSLGSDKFGISVHAFTDIFGATLKVEALNFKGLTEINIHSKSWNSLNRGERRNFNVTSKGETGQASVYVRATSGNVDLFLAKNSLPNLDDDSSHHSTCGNCFCEATELGHLNSCEFSGLKEDSFIVSVVAHLDSKDVKLAAAGLNVKELKAL